MTLPLAFYAPLKDPDHPVPSGDRTMGRLLLRALAAAGFAPQVESRLRTWDAAGSGHAAIREASGRETERILAEIGRRPAEERPRLWLTYHVYYKAPDWIGPAVAQALAIPYAVVEGSRAGKRAHGPHRLGHAAAEAALDAAAAIFVMTGADREALRRSADASQVLVDLPPFVATVPSTGTGRASPHRLLVVGMMRPGDKFASYRLLARALSRLEAPDWSLDVAGDGPERAAVAGLFAPFGPRVRLHGLCDAVTLSRLYASASLLVWPAVNEAYGLALLEAQAQGCPVVAGGYGGVRDALHDGMTGLVTPPGDADAFALAIDALLADPARRDAMGRAAARFVRDERGLDQAAARLRGGLVPLLGRVGCDAA